MSEILTLQAETRTLMGRKSNRLRIEGKSPAVLYGLKEQPISLTLDIVPFVKLYEKAGSSTLIDVVVDGGEPIKALIGEIQTHPVTDRLRHVDLQRVDMKAVITADIPLKFVGESAAVKAMSGILTTQIDSIEVECLPGDLVHEIVVDISVLKAFDVVIHVKDLNVSDKIKVITDGEQIVAAVKPPRSEKELADLNTAVVEDVSTVSKEEKVKKETDEPAPEK